MRNILFGTAYAQEGTTQTQTVTPSSGTSSQPAGAPSAPSPLASFAPFVLIFVVFYFLLIRPQKKKLQEEQNLLSTLGKGDEIYTKSGLLGTISGLTDKVVTLEVADGVKIKVLRSYVGGLAKKLFETASPTTALPAATAAKNGKKKESTVGGAKSS